MKRFKTLLSVSLVACAALALSLTVSAHGGHHGATTQQHAVCGQSCFVACTQTGAGHVHTADCGTHAEACPRLQSSSNTTTQRPATCHRSQGRGYGYGHHA